LAASSDVRPLEMAVSKRSTALNHFNASESELLNRVYSSELNLNQA